MQPWVSIVSTIRKTITLTEHQDAWLKSQIAAGLYTNDSEAIRDLIRKAQADAEESDLEAIRVALIKGERSGVTDETLDTIEQRVLARHAGKHGVAPL